MNTSFRVHPINRRRFFTMAGQVACAFLGHKVASAFSRFNDAEVPEWLNYTSIDSIDDSPTIFRKMISAMGDLDRAILAQSLRMLPALEEADFGRFGLKAYEDYHPNQRPTSFNELPPEAVVEAVRRKRIPSDLISADAIIRQLIWVSSSIFTYWGKSGVYYHDLVCWVARCSRVPRDKLEAPTFVLERRILEQMFADIWDRLDTDQREELLSKIEQATGARFQNKAGIAALTGAGALAALGATVAMSGFAFYTTMSVVICTVAGFFGVTLPFVVYTTASSTVALLAGPVGWVAAGVLAVIGLAALGAANPRKTAGFIIALHMRKAYYFNKLGLLPSDWSPDSANYR